MTKHRAMPDPMGNLLIIKAFREKQQGQKRAIVTITVGL
jgi:hypothetical protein